MGFARCANRWAKGCLRSLTLGGCLIAGMLCSCSLPVTASSTGPDVTVAPADSDLVGRWTDKRTGRELPDGSAMFDGRLVVNTVANSTTCDAENVTVLMQLALPLGTEVALGSSSSTESALPKFIRDTSNSSKETSGDSDLDATLPRTARQTFFELNGNKLSVSDGDKSVYVVRADKRVERWARIKPGVACA